MSCSGKMEEMRWSGQFCSVYCQILLTDCCVVSLYSIFIMQLEFESVFKFHDSKNLSLSGSVITGGNR